MDYEASGIGQQETWTIPCTPIRRRRTTASSAAEALMLPKRLVRQWTPVQQQLEDGCRSQ
jgi:hypothetical protein